MPTSLSSLLSHLSSLYPKTPLDALKTLLILFYAVNYRIMPGYWHITMGRFAAQAAIARAIEVVQRRNLSENEKGASIARGFFSEVVAEWVVTPGDSDINMHLSNTSYGVYADYSRTALIFRSGVSDALVFAAPDPLRRTRMMVGSTEYRYFKEIPIGVKFVVRTRWSGWNRKWFIVETRFENPSGTVLHCVGHAKMVVKRGGKTLRPAKMLKEIGIPDDHEQYMRPPPECCLAMLQDTVDGKRLAKL